jgi:serine/threonine protein phosphatase PrpC
MEGKQSQFHIKNAVSVKEVGYHEDKNYPSRLNMEDCTTFPNSDSMCHDNFASNGSGLFGIFDGHGGSQVSEYSSQVLPNVPA